MDISTFSGDHDIEGFLDWLIKVDHFFEYAKIPKEQKGNRSINEYTAELLRLAVRNHLSESDNQQATQYLRGLKPSIRDKIGIRIVISVQEARNLALKAEVVIKERIYHDPYQKYQYGGDDKHGEFEKIKEVAQGK
ncbi:hypothetical protein GH714_043822 [Hevea brasiliensis]|uniref:Retrotransposon gag domain-containing protein n=1 Tax=Hevea brasiliensis TaxID=3981 RepID=A0A6A6K4G5_HEVBR|nr:hypothetical protein GH714_043822 [Hevea brasiliensis]